MERSFPAQNRMKLWSLSEYLYGLQFKTVCYYSTVSGTATCVLLSADLFGFFQELDHNFQTLLNKLWYSSTTHGTVPLCVGLLGYCSSFSVQIIFASTLLWQITCRVIQKVDCKVVLRGRFQCWNLSRKCWPRQIRSFPGIRIYVSQPLMLEETFLIVQNVGNGHIYIRVMKQHTL